MDSLRIFKLQVLAVALFLVPIWAYGYFKDNIKSPAPTHPDRPLVLDLGMTLKEFRAAYAEKVESIEEPFFRWSDTSISNGNGVLIYSYPCVYMVVYENKDTGNVNKIVVSAELFDSTGRYGKTFILLSQSMVFSFATSVFSSNMEYQQYRESVLRRLYSGLNTGENILNGNMKFSATKKGNVISLIAEAKDLN